MKPISELGLELIELEDQVLLVRGGQIPDNWYLDDANQIRESVIDDPEYWEGRLGYKSIIASTKKYEGLTLLVIEDEVDDLAEDHTNIRILQHKTSIQVATQYFDGFKEGYNKAKETYKFTEEDLRKAIDMAREEDGLSDNTMSFVYDEDFIIQSLTKKELWIEVELSLIKESHKTGYTVEKLVPKIVYNQIKAVWK